MSLVLGQRCPVCASPLDPRPVEIFDSSELLACGACGLQIWEPRLSGSSAWYDESAHYRTTAYIEWLGWYHERTLRELPRGIGSLLDIGCGDGRFVYAAASRGIDAVGIDHSERLAALANERHGGRRVSRATVEDLRSEGRRFDAVTLFDVIEHVPEPLELLRVSAGLLHPGGMLAVTTPNRLGYPWGRHPLDRPPHHLTRWTPAVLERALVLAGLTRPRMILSSGEVGVRSFLMDHLRLGLVTRAMGGPPRGGQENTRSHRAAVRLAVVAKDRLIRGAARALAPFVGRRFAGGSMLALARLPRETGR